MRLDHNHFSFFYDTYDDVSNFEKKINRFRHTHSILRLLDGID